MKAILIITISLFTLPSFGQVVTVWKGNFPGHQHKWECPQNWSTNTVPDEFSDVVIPLDLAAQTHYPKINGDLEINSLHISTGASLAIHSGQLAILDVRKSVFRHNQLTGKGTVKQLFNEMTPSELSANKGTH